MNLIWLILQFIFIGSLTFGGGLVAITFLFDVFVTGNIISEVFYLQMITIAESTPGPIAINLATYLGFSQFGILGGVITTLSFILPSMLLIWTLYPLYRRHANSPYLQSLMIGLRVVVFGIILIAMVRMGLSFIEELTMTPIQTLSLSLLTLLFMPQMKNRPYILLMIGAVFGILFF
ncbi:MAG: chromate transporter [Firmicutes bacterium]|nr:chromate transporter [Bacillota bacterium]